MKKIDINCDVGEGLKNEEQIFPFISSCNIACGGHAGDKDSIARIVRLAKTFEVKIGAHPSYPDPENFGRKSMELDQASLSRAIRTQLETFKEAIDSENGHWHHIKAHGALYNDLAASTELSELYIKAIEPYLDHLKLYVPYGSKIADIAGAHQIPFLYEGFADRNYNDDLSLVKRSHPKALINEPKTVLLHILQMVRKGEVLTIQGSKIPIRAETFCVHSDTPAALQILMYLASELPREQIEIAK